MRVFAVIVLLSLSPGAGLRAQDEPPAVSRSVDAGMDLAEAAASLLGKTAFGVYLDGQKVGWAIEEYRFGEHEGQQVLEFDSTMEMVELADGRRSVTRYREQHAYSLQSSGQLVRIEYREDQHGRSTTVAAVRDGDGMLLTRRAPGVEPKVTRIAMPRQNLAEDLRVQRWLAAGRQAGDRTTWWTSDLSRAEIDREETVTYVAAQQLATPSGALDGHVVDMTASGGTMRCHLLPSGRVHQISIGSTFELRAEPEAQAVEMATATPMDLNRTQAIAADRPIGVADNVGMLTVELIGDGTLRVPDSARQRVSRSPEGHLRVQLVRCPEPGPAAALDAETKARHLRPTPALPSDDPELQAQARAIVGEERDPVAMAWLLQSWVYEQLTYSETGNASGALEILASRSGDCSEHALLFVGLARAAGVPARVVGGVVYDETESPRFLAHAWAEIHDGARWVSVDPTWNQLVVDASHIKFSEGLDDWSDMNALGYRAHIVDCSPFADHVEPDLQLLLDVDGRAAPIVLGQQLTLPTTGEDVRVLVTARPERSLRIGELELEYPRALRFLYTPYEHYGYWSVYDDVCSIGCWRKTCHDRFDALHEITEQFAAYELERGATTERGTVTMELAGAVRHGIRMDAVLDDVTTRYELVRVPMRDHDYGFVFATILVDGQPAASAEHAIAVVKRSIRRRSQFGS